MAIRGEELSDPEATCARSTGTRSNRPRASGPRARQARRSADTSAAARARRRTEGSARPIAVVSESSLHAARMTSEQPADQLGRRRFTLVSAGALPPVGISVGKNCAVRPNVGGASPRRVPFLTSRAAPCDKSPVFAVLAGCCRSTGARASGGDAAASRTTMIWSTRISRRRHQARKGSRWRSPRSRW